MATSGKTPGTTPIQLVTRRLGRCALLALATSAAGALLSCVATVSDVPVVDSTGTTGEQAETALSVGTTPAGNVQIVAFYNDFTIGTTAGGLPEFVYDPAGNQISIQKGSSVMGWSLGAGPAGMIGGTWSYEGKVKPPSGTAYLAGDPTTATAPLDPTPRANET